MNLRSIRFIFIFLAGVTINHSCTKEYSCESCKGNSPPIANAGRDTTIVLPVDSMQLDGSASFDPDGSIVSYKWIKISGPASFSILQIDSAKTLTNGLAMGVYEFELTVKDNSGLSAKDTVQIIVIDLGVNQPPVAKAGADQTIALPADSVLLDGSSSFDPDGKIVSYKWIEISGPASYSVVQPDSAITYVKNLVAGVYQYELTVTDDGRLSSKDSITINVNGIPNRAPVANAGPDQIIYLPASSINLDGSASTDPDNNIISYLWTKISGPTLFNISNSGTAITQVINLVQGAYQFELKVTDAGGLFSKDTMQVIVQDAICDISNRPIRNASSTLITQLPQPRFNINVVSVGNKIISAGGNTNFSSNQATNFSDKVDIYDITTGQWSATQLSEPRIVDAVAVLGNKIFFAGGTNDSGFSKTVDIYDISANTWSVAYLSQARKGIGYGVLGRKVFFTGGTNWLPIGDNYFRQELLNIVDVYDAVTNSWSTASLSAGRYCFHDLEKITPTIVGQKIFFVGGSCNTIQDCSSNRIDVYDAAASAWSGEDYSTLTGSLFSAVAAGNKNYFVTGGYWDGGKIVEIRDEVTHAISYDCLSGTLFQPPVRNDNNLVFPVSVSPMWTAGFSLTHFDIYDLTTNTWSISKLPASAYYYDLVSVNNELYAMGGASFTNGFLFNKIYKLNY